jgi:hypothetical protein
VTYEEDSREGEQEEGERRRRGEERTRRWKRQASLSSQWLASSPEGGAIDSAPSFSDQNKSHHQYHQHHHSTPRLVREK